MRSALLIIISLAVLIGVFFIYTLVQPSRPTRGTNSSQAAANKSSSAAPATSPANPSLPLASGDNVFIERYDNETGLIASRFRATRYDPQPDGTVNVDKPEAEFYLSSREHDETGQPARQLLRLRGDHGEVVVPPGGGGTNAGGSSAMSSMQMPSRGKMHDVTIMLFESVRAKKPSLTCRVNNLAFDNDTFRIATEAFTDARGKLIDADQVPVSVRGDYDFDGRGLTVLWDEKDRHLQMLEVAHGQQLRINKRGAFDAPGAPKTPTAASDGAAPKPAAPATKPAKSSTGRRGKKNAASAPATVPAASPTTLRSGVEVMSPTTTPSHDPIPYRASFFDHVVVTQDNLQLASADVLHVDFVNENGSADRSNSAGAASSAAGAKADITGSNESSARRPATRATTSATNRRTSANAAHRGSPSSPSPSPDPQTVSPTTAPAAPGPLIVQWTGKLHVTATPPDVTPPDPHDSVFELISNSAHPVLLHWQGSDVVCASLRYHSLNDSATIRSSETTPLVRMTDPRGTKLATPNFDYDGESRIAVLRGVSHAELPIESNASTTNGATVPSTRPAEFANVDWSDRCTLHLAAPRSADSKSMAIESADVVGDVKVKSPQMDLDSQRLELTFEPPDNASSALPNDATRSTNPQIRELLATGVVHGIVRSNSGAENGAGDPKPQLIDSERLNVIFDRTGDGANTVYARQLIADGAVRTSDGASELRADHLDATLAPTTRPATTQPIISDATTRPAIGAAAKGEMASVQIVGLDASGGVRARGANGEFAEADKLRLTQVGGHPSYLLTGPPGTPARVGNEKSIITGPIINLQPETGNASVVGPGSLHAIQQPAPGAATRPVDVTWSKGLEADEANDRINITGDVVTRSALEDGSTNIARGATMVMTLADAQPVDAAGTTRAATTSPTRTPTTARATTKPTTRRAASSGGGFAGAFGGSSSSGSGSSGPRDKVVRSVTLTDPKNVEVQSTLSSATGALLRRIHLFAPSLTYELQDKRLVVPSAGRMLYDDQRGGGGAPAIASAATKPSATTKSSATTTMPTAARPTTSPAGSGALGEMRGATAFQWEKEFIYSDAEHRATMSGGVTVVHQAPGGVEGYRLLAERVIAEMEPDPPATAPAAGNTSPTTRSAPGQAKLKRMIADGGAVLTSKDLQFTADHVEYDPETQELRARGTPSAPATLFHATGMSQGTFDELFYDTKNDRIRLVNFRAAVRK